MQVKYNNFGKERGGGIYISVFMWELYNIGYCMLKNSWELMHNTAKP